MIKFIHTADVHLGLKFNKVSFPRELAINRRFELWSSFEGLVGYCKEKGIDFLLIAGDLFEASYFTLGDIKRLRDLFKEARDINILIAAGNHDYLNDKSLYRKVEWSDNVHIFDTGAIGKKEFPELDTVIYGYSWDSLEIRENFLFEGFEVDNSFSNKILLIHGDLARSSNYLPLDLDLLNKLDLDYIALGHIHKPIIFSDKMAYCGSLEPLDFGELGERGFIEGLIGDSGTKVRFVPFSKRKFLHERLKLNENMNYRDIVGAIKAVQGEKDRDLFRIELEGYISQDIEFKSLLKSLEGDFYYVEFIDKTTPDYDLEALEREYKDSLIGEFIRAMKLKGLDEPVVKKALYFGLDALLRGRVDS